MKTQYFTASSLDGFIADSHDSLDWLFPLGDIEDTSYPSFIRDVGALAMGSCRPCSWRLPPMALTKRCIDHRLFGYAENFSNLLVALDSGHSSAR